VDVGGRDLARRVCSENTYAGFVERFYKENNQTTEVHVDSLVLLYKLTRSDRVFDILFKCHRILLKTIAHKTYNNYRRHLIADDADELESMIYGEFFRRVMYYKIPPEAPFSGWVKSYLTKWANSYIKGMVRDRMRYQLGCDSRDDIMDVGRQNETTCD
jgi:hypothetical protein